MRQLRHLELMWFMVEGNAEWSPLEADECIAAFTALARLESFRLNRVCGINLLLPHIAHAPALRTLNIRCAAESFREIDIGGGEHPRRKVVRRLLTAAPQLEVQLEVTSNIETWRSANEYRWASAASCELMDDQWRELQRMGAEMERVTVVADTDLE